MKTKKSLKFSKETVILLDKNAKKGIKGGAATVNCPTIYCPTKDPRWCSEG
ncbi:hypothetical protein [Chryseobacterium sp. PMSZPI]|uniref:hypothetical protein n=1 Tax=Chryseobacterium sp. PMSZPI TaxID=1033900 RepID=UPI00161039F1|nr:hypothetical protein [Chryseobacterium sp. PMSZPI]